MFFVKIKLSMIEGYLAPGFEGREFTLTSKDQAELFLTKQEAEEVVKQIGIGEVEN